MKTVAIGKINKRKKESKLASMNFCKNSTSRAIGDDLKSSPL